jgi:hypothetical protein
VAPDSSESGAGGVDALLYGHGKFRRNGRVIHTEPSLFDAGSAAKTT